MIASIIVKAEYRGATPETMVFPANGNKPARTINRVVYALEIENQPYSLPEDLPDGMKPETWKAPAKKGEWIELGLSLEPANVATIVNGKAQASRGLWRVNVVHIRPWQDAKKG